LEGHGEPWRKDFTKRGELAGLALGSRFSGRSFTPKAFLHGPPWPSMVKKLFDMVCDSN
jgi:hypothetical protein